MIQHLVPASVYAGWFSSPTRLELWRSIIYMIPSDTWRGTQVSSPSGSKPALLLGNSLLWNSPLCYTALQSHSQQKSWLRQPPAVFQKEITHRKYKGQNLTKIAGHWEKKTGNRSQAGQGQSLHFMLRRGEQDFSPIEANHAQNTAECGPFPPPTSLLIYSQPLISLELL